MSEMELTAVEPVMRLRDQINVIRGTVAKGASPAQLEMFLSLAERYQLDPFLKEIWFVPEVGIMTARDGYLKVAMRDPNYDGIVSAAVREGDVFTMEPLTPTIKHQFGAKRGAVIGAYAVVFHKGRRPAVSYADMSEYRKGGSVWSKYQSAMIQKVAEVMALKRQFGISGLVTEEELGLPNSTNALSGLAPAGVIDAAFALAPFASAQDVPDPASLQRMTELEVIQAGMRDRDSIGKAIETLRERLAARVGEEEAAEAFERLLRHHNAGQWQDLKIIGVAKKFAADLYALAQGDAYDE